MQLNSSVDKLRHQKSFGAGAKQNVTTVSERTAKGTNLNNEAESEIEDGQIVSGAQTPADQPSSKKTSFVSQKYSVS